LFVTYGCRTFPNEQRLFLPQFLKRAGERLDNFRDFADTHGVCPYFSKSMILRQLFCFVLLLGFAVPCFAQGNTADIDQQFTADVLKTTLFARTAEERQFCDYVIQKRDDGTIPRRIIYGVYQKAVTKDRSQRFIYFKTGLEILCKREGIVLNPMPVKTAPRTSPLIPSALRGFFQRNG